MCKHTDCVTVCPVDCFYEGPNFLVINPNECIDCGVCIPECPVNAIVMDDDKTVEDMPFWLTLNERLSNQWPNITEAKDALPDAAEWKDKPNKIDLLEEWNLSLLIYRTNFQIIGLELEDGTLKTKPEVLHAETNALAKVAQSTESSQGATLFCTHAPCIDCAKLIYQSGIETVYYKETYRSEDGLNFLRKSGINVHRHTDRT